MPLEIDRSKLVSALDTFNPETSLYCGEFPKLAEVFINQFPRQKRPNEIDRGPEITYKINRYAIGRVAHGLMKVRKQLNSIFTLCHKIYNQKELCRQNKLGDEICNSYLSEDIDLFLLKYRFIYDNISEVIRTATDTYLDNHDWTFGELRSRVRKKDILMDREFIELIEEYEYWHHGICSIGLLIQNTECKSWVKLDTDSNEIIFDALWISADAPGEFHSVIPGFNYKMERSNFYLFAGLCVGYLIWYLEKLSEIIFRHLQINVPSSNIEIFHPGVFLIYNWIDKLVGILK